MKPLQNKVMTLLISSGVLYFSVSSYMNLSTMPLDSYTGAVWGFASITLTLFGLLISPVLVVMSLGGIVKNAVQSARKPKQKNSI